MTDLIEKIRQGEDYFGSGGHTTPEFNKFYMDFKKAIHKKLLKIDGYHSLQLNKGHFYISGFFSVGEQAYYISLSDVRWNMRAPEQILVRTASSYKDYTGGQNNYAKLSTLAEDIIRIFRL